MAKRHGYWTKRFLDTNGAGNGRNYSVRMRALGLLGVI